MSEHMKEEQPEEGAIREPNRNDYYEPDYEEPGKLYFDNEGYNKAVTKYNQLASKSEPAGEKITEIFGVLNLAQAEIRAMYKRTGIIGSTILDKIDNILIPYLDEQKNNNLT